MYKVIGNSRAGNNNASNVKYAPNLSYDAPNFILSVIVTLQVSGPNYFFS